jgi:hypothetical protein
VPVTVVLINGRPLSINWIAAHIPAILECWYPGQEGGTAVAEALFGDINPGGKLPVTLTSPLSSDFARSLRPNVSFSCETSRIVLPLRCFSTYIDSSVLFTGVFSATSNRFAGSSEMSY